MVSVLWPLLPWLFSTNFHKSFRKCYQHLTWIRIYRDHDQTRPAKLTGHYLFNNINLVAATLAHEGRHRYCVSSGGENLLSFLV